MFATGAGYYRSLTPGYTDFECSPTSVKPTKSSRDQTFTRNPPQVIFVSGAPTAALQILKIEKQRTYASIKHM
jgi:hypothetical protein